MASAVVVFDKPVTKRFTPVVLVIMLAKDGLAIDQVPPVAFTDSSVIAPTQTEF